MHNHLQSISIWILCCSLQAAQDESLFSQADQDAIAAVISLARQHGLTDTTGGKMVWDDLMLERHHKRGASGTTVEGPHIQLANGDWLLACCWPAGAKLPIKREPGHFNASNWFRCHSFVIPYRQDGQKIRQTAFQYNVTTRLSARLTTQHRRWLKILGENDLPTDVTCGQLGLTIAHLWDIKRPVAERLLALCLFKMSMYRWDAWFSTHKPPLLLSRVQVGSEEKTSWTGAFNTLYPDDKATELLAPATALRLLLINSLRTTITKDMQLQDKFYDFESADIPNNFINRPNTGEALAAIKALMPMSQHHAKKELRNLNTIIELEKETDTSSSLISRLRQWRSYWPDSSKVVRHDGFWAMRHSWGMRLPTINQTGRMTTSDYPFTETDLDDLFKTIDNAELCRWYDDSLSRTIGDNALRALAGLLGSDPRQLIAANWEQAWTDERRMKIAQELQAWRQENADLTLADIQRQLIPTMSYIDLAWHLDRAEGEQLNKTLSILAKLWSDKAPNANQRHFDSYEDIANTRDVAKLIALVLNRAGHHQGIAKTIENFPISGRLVDTLLIYHFQEKNFTKLTEALRENINNKKNRFNGSLLAIGYNHEMITAERAWLAKHLNPETQQLNRIYLPSSLFMSSWAMLDLPHDESQAIVKHLSLIRLAIVKDALADKRAAPPCLQDLVKKSHRYAKDADIKQLSIGMALAILVTGPMNHNMADALQGAVDGAYPWCPRLDRSQKHREECLAELLRLLPEFLPEELARAGLADK